MSSDYKKQVWDQYLSHTDRDVFEAAGFGAKAGMGDRPVMLVIDVNYNFCGDRKEPILESIKRWKLSCGEAAWNALPIITKLLKIVRSRGIPVIYTTGYGRVDKWDRGGWSWKNPRSQVLPEFVSQQSTNRDGNEIMDEISPEPQDLVVWKQKPSAFHEAPLESYLQLFKTDTLIITGTTTSGCVRATAVDAFSRNYKVSVVEDACFDRVDLSHAASLLDLHAKYVDVMNSEEVISYLNTIPTGLFELPEGC